MAKDPGYIVRIARGASSSFTLLLVVISVVPASAIHRMRPNSMARGSFHVFFPERPRDMHRRTYDRPKQQRVDLAAGLGCAKLVGRT